jgi:hypothetical protein
VTAVLGSFAIALSNQLLLLLLGALELLLKRESSLPLPLRRDSIGDGDVFRLRDLGFPTLRLLSLLLALLGLLSLA